MKKALLIFAKRNGFCNSAEEIDNPETFQSAYSTEPKRFELIEGDINEDLLEEIQNKIGPEARIVFTEADAPHTGEIAEVETINLYKVEDEILKKEA